jgi:DNA-binding NarL/FixJ family response regulator
MREFIIADNQDISKAGMMFLLSKQKEVSLLLEADNKAELIQQLRLYPQAVIILDYTLFNFAGADELIVLQERFKEADWILFLTQQHAAQKEKQKEMQREQNSVPKKRCRTW